MRTSIFCSMLYFCVLVLYGCISEKDGLNKDKDVMLSKEREIWSLQAKIVRKYLLVHKIDFDVIKNLSELYPDIKDLCAASQIEFRLELGQEEKEFLSLLCKEREYYNKLVEAYPKIRDFNNTELFQLFEDTDLTVEEHLEIRKRKHNYERN